jgi:hypothetical protein
MAAAGLAGQAAAGRSRAACAHASQAEDVFSAQEAQLRRLQREHDTLAARLDSTAASKVRCQRAQPAHGSTEVPPSATQHLLPAWLCPAGPHLQAGPDDAPLPRIMFCRWHSGCLAGAADTPAVSPSLAACSWRQRRLPRRQRSAQARQRPRQPPPRVTCKNWQRSAKRWPARSRRRWSRRRKWERQLPSSWSRWGGASGVLQCRRTQSRRGRQQLIVG